MNKFLRTLTLAASLGLAAGAQANIVTNGNFETGDFTGWTQTGNTPFNGVACGGFGAGGVGCGAFFGPIGSIGGISQTLSTVAGKAYFVSFLFEADGGIPSSFAFNWDGGAAELSLTNMPASGYVQHTFEFLASGASTTISFDFRDDPGFLALDNVNVTAAPEPGSLALLGLGLAGLAAIRKRKQA